MKIIYLSVIVSLLVFTSCEEPDNAINYVLDNVRNGAVLRTRAINNSVYDVQSPATPISYVLEMQDGNEGELLDRVDVFLSFVDRTSENGDNSTSSVLFKTLSASDFTQGERGYPVTELTITTQELLENTNLTTDEISCTDKFVIDLTLHLTNGLAFNHENSIGPIISYPGSINSPFSYDIYVVEGIDNDKFTGVYDYSSVVNGFDGPTFITPNQFTLERSRPNVRHFEIFRDTQQMFDGTFILSEVEFTIACDQAIMTRYIRSAIVCSARVEADHQVLLGPSNDLNGTIDEIDDTVFDLRFIEGFEGNDGFCGWPVTPSTFRLTKQ